MTLSTSFKCSAICVPRRALVRSLATKLTLDLLMPNMKRLRYCTEREAAAFGTAYARLAEQVGPNGLVGEVVCEAEARDALMRANSAALDRLLAELIRLPLDCQRSRSRRTS